VIRPNAWLGLAACVAVLAPLLAAQPAYAQASFRGIGDLEGGAVFSEALGVSVDGTVVVGNSHSEAGRQAVISFPGGFLLALDGVATLPDLPFDAGHDVAMNPVTVVGEADTGPSIDAVRWLNVAGVSLWTGVAYGISLDGTVIVGQRSSDFVPVKWEGSVVTALDLGVGTAYATSADGSVIIGQSGPQAFRWVSGSFGSIPGLEPSSSIARDISDNGLVIVGTYGGIPEEAFRWIGGVSNRLGGLDPNDITSRAFGVSGNGSRVVGESINVSEELEAFYWDGFNGLRSLKSMLVNDHGLNLTGWTLERAEAISTDGSTIVGWGTNPSGDREGFVARIPVPPALCGDVNEDLSLGPLDVDAFRSALADPAGAPLGTGEDRCTVIGPLRPCDVRDVVVLRREVEGPLMAPGVLQICSAIP
jgi:uncharacterized membrane protein